MSQLSALNGGPSTWFVNTKGELIELRLVDNTMMHTLDTARAVNSRYAIRHGAGPVPEARIPQEWLIYDRRKTSISEPVKRIFSATIDAAHVWCVHMQERS